MRSWFIPDGDPKQSLRLRRFFMGTSFYGIWLSIIGLMIYQGVLNISAPLLALEISGAVISNLVFYTLLRSGMNQQLADPSMTVISCLCFVCLIFEGEYGDIW